MPISDKYKYFFIHYKYQYLKLFSYIFQKMSTDDISIVVAVITGILDPKNEVRKDAEAKLAELRGNAPALLFCLLKILESDHLTTNNLQLKKTKITAAVLTRKLLEIKDDELINIHWAKMDSETKTHIKNILINCFVNEKDPSLRQKICDVIIQTANNVFESDEKWDDLLQILVKAINMGNDAGFFQQTTPTVCCL
jgi:hypothetical protein